MQTIIVSATAKEFYTDTDLYKSLVHHKLVDMYARPGLIDVLNIKTENKEGLTSVYNNFLDKYQDKDTIIFAHDDIAIDSVNFIETVNSFLHEKEFAVAGLAGGSKIQKRKPFLWHLITKKDTQSGIVFHPHGEYNYPTTFGPTPKEVAVLDGCFLAVNVKKLKEKNVRFDENIKGFHQYDMKFCIDCKKAGLRLTTMPINTIHNSPGLSNVKDKGFLECQDYILKSIS
tara:strand:+ start:2615 stop:3301 length:687 start_codon:yes stop_codon:yes gene_type:complete